MARSWNFGRPKKGAPIVAYRDVRLQHAGKVWTASYHVDDSRLVISSAWGSRSEPVSPDLPINAFNDRARGLLDQLIRERIS